jgi:glycosyltransferase involved in cell wall biosynthesis
MIKGLVSCVIPTYKRSDTLVKSINSVLCQTYPNIEVLVVDDNEPNNVYSLDVQYKLSKIQDERVKYIKQVKHINGAAARNVGIRASQGEFVAFLDDDDEWLPEKVGKQVDYLNKHQEISGVSVLYTYYFNGIPTRKCLHYTTEELHLKVLNRSVAICTPTVLLRKSALDETEYFNESLKRHQDLQLLLDFLYEHKMEVIQEYLVVINTDSTENRANTETIVAIKTNFFNVIPKHFERYDKKTKRNIYAAHYFEIAFVALKNKNKRIAIKYILKVGFNPQAYKELFNRYKVRKIARV